MAHYDEQRERELDDLLIKHANQFQEAGRLAQEEVKDFLDSAEAQDFLLLNFIIKNISKIKSFLIAFGFKPYNYPTEKI